MITIYAQLFGKEFVNTLTFDELVIYLKDPQCIFWIDLDSPTLDEIHQIQDAFNFHPLCIEDVMSYSNSPKLDEFDEYIFLVTHEPRMHSKTNEIERPEIDFFLGKNYLVSVHHEPSPAIAKSIHRCETQLLYHQAALYEKGSRGRTAIKDNFMFKNSDFILHTILDHIVDDYFPLVEKWEDDIDHLEEHVLSVRAERSVLNEILKLKRQLAGFRRTVSPQRDVLSRLIHLQHPAMSKASVVYFRDIFDHLIRVNELIDTYRDTMSNVLDAYYSVLSHQINENSHIVNIIMKRLTIITTIFMPLTFIAGIYGMNFHNMPEIRWEYGYYYALGLMGALALSMFYFFRKKFWF